MYTNCFMIVQLNEKLTMLHGYPISNIKWGLILLTDTSPKPALNYKTQVNWIEK